MSDGLDPLNSINARRRTYTHFDDCDGLGTVFTDLKQNSSGATAVLDEADGVVEVATGATTPLDNDECYRESAEVLKFENSFKVVSRIKFTEANTDDANVLAIGFQNAPVLATVLGDAGAGPRGTYYGAMIYKVDGGTKWVCQTSVGSTQSTDTTDVLSTSSDFVDFEIEFQPTENGGTYGEVSFKIDGQHCTIDGSNTGERIKHEIALASATEMAVLSGIKCGAATQEEVLKMDYIGWQAYRS